MKKAIISILMALILVAGMMTPAFAQSGSYEIKRFSNKESTSITDADGLIASGDRGNSYAWSMAQTENYVWIGMNRNLLSSAVTEIANSLGEGLTNAIEAALCGVIDLSADLNNNLCPVIVRYNKATEEIETFFISPDVLCGAYGAYEFGADYGFRVAVTYENSVYFGTMAGGLGMNRILRFDESMNPGDSPEVCYSIPSYGGETSIRAITIHNGVMYIGVINAKDKVQILRNADPRNAQGWEVVATEADFDNIVKAGGEALGGGGIWEMSSCNGYLYASVITSGIPTPDNGVSYSGWALYKGKENSDGTWTWKPIVSSVEDALYPLGVGVNTHTLATTYEMGGKLYIGTFNPPVDAVTDVARWCTLDPIYKLTQNPTHLYVLDENDKLEMLVGDPNPYVGNSTTGLYAGYAKKQGTNTEFYTWRFTQHNGKLYIGTFDAYSLVNMVANMDVVSAVKLIIDPAADTSKRTLKDKALENIIEKIVLPNANVFAKAASGALNLLKKLNGVIKLSGNLGKLVEAADDIQPLLNNIAKNFKYSQLVSIRKTLDKVKKADGAGFNIYVYDPETGELETITENGFGNRFNYGVRTMEALDDRVVIGTANPFYGCQLWGIIDK